MEVFKLFSIVSKCCNEENAEDSTRKIEDLYLNILFIDNVFLKRYFKVMHNWTTIKVCEAIKAKGKAEKNTVEIKLEEGENANDVSVMRCCPLARREPLLCPRAFWPLS